MVPLAKTAKGSYFAVLMAAPGDDIAGRIAAEGLSIYDDLSDDPNYVYDIATLEARLNLLLPGLNLDYPIRTRAKVAKARVAEALGYPVPLSFTKTHPRFPGQDLDVAVQMHNNFQVYNEDRIDPGRRYVLIRVDAAGVATKVRVLTGEEIALFDKTGTLTSKFQAKRRAGSTGSKLVSDSDTEAFIAALRPVPDLPEAILSGLSPTAQPRPDLVLAIPAVGDRLEHLVGIEIDDPGLVQERNRGAVVHRLACEALSLGEYADGGQFPDILSQVLEIKFQLSPTIDLGLVAPDSDEPAVHAGHGLRHCDTRYAVVYGSRDGSRLRIEGVVVSTGKDFFEEFQRFEGLVENKKFQIPLPGDLFDPE